MKRYFRVESYKGGGARGTISAVLKSCLELAVSGVRDAEPDARFGTSTGGFIAAGRAMGISIGTILGLYEERCGEIFSRSAGKIVSSGGGVLACKYENAGLRKVLEEVFGKDTLVGDVPGRFGLTVYDLDSADDWPDKKPREDRTYVLHNWPGSKHLRVRLVDALLRTSAACPFLPAHDGCIDGGFWANDPAMAAVSSCCDDGGLDVADVKVLSFGTGRMPGHWEGSPRWGLADFAPKAVPIWFGGASHGIGWYCRSIMKDRYCDVDVLLDKDYPLDDAAAVPELILATQEAIRKGVLAPAEAFVREWAGQGPFSTPVTP